MYTFVLIYWCQIKLFIIEDFIYGLCIHRLHIIMEDEIMQVKTITSRDCNHG